MHTFNGLPTQRNARHVRETVVASWSQICAIVGNARSHSTIWQAHCGLDNGPPTGIFLPPRQRTSGGNATVVASPPPTTTATTPSRRAPAPAVAPRPLSSMPPPRPDHERAVPRPTGDTSSSEDSSDSTSSAEDPPMVRYFPAVRKLRHGLERGANLA